MPLDPNMPPDEMPPTDEMPPEVPPEQGGAQLPADNMNAPMAEGLQDATPEEQEMADQFVGRAWQLIYDDRTFPHIVEMLRGGEGPATPEAAPPEGGPAPGAPPPEAGGVPPGAPPPAPGAPPPGAPPPEGMPPEGMPPEAGGAPPEVPPEVPPPEGAPEGAAPEGAPGDPVSGLASATDMVVAKVGEAAEQAGQELQPDVVFHAAGDIFEELAEISRRAKIKDYAKDPDALESAWFQALDLYRERLQAAGAIDQGHAQADLDKLVKADADGTFERIMRSLADSDNSGPAGGPEPPPQKEKKPKGFNAAMGI